MDIHRDTDIRHRLIARFQIGMVSGHGVQLCPQVPPTSSVEHRDQQHYVCCENYSYPLAVGMMKIALRASWIIPSHLAF